MCYKSHVIGSEPIAIYSIPDPMLLLRNFLNSNTLPDLGIEPETLDHCLVNEAFDKIYRQIMMTQVLIARENNKNLYFVNHPSEIN
uniref:SFRICE_007072 n=1 Tax=Spodoptera frugiperda TaxID=7108 RepID=A0A2H1WB99_SPOFR